MTYPSHRRSRVWRISWSTALGILLLVAAAYIVTAQYAAGEDAQRRGDCQARINTELVEALQRRDMVNKQLSQAQRDVVATRVRTTSASDRDAADRRYLDALDDVDSIRATNPIPAVTAC